MSHALTQTVTTQLPTRGLSRHYASDTRLYNRWLNGRKPSAESLTAYFAELSQTHRVATVNRKKSALKKAILAARGNSLTIAERAQLTEVFASIKTGQAQKTVAAHEVLTRDELAAITERAGAKSAAIVTALYESAARVSELASLRLADCQARGETVLCEIRRGKGGKQRTAYLSKETFETLKELYKGKTYLIEYRGRPVSRFTLSKLVKKAGAVAGRTDIHAHTLRHTKATHLLIGGMSLPAVSAYCGHADPATTARFYLHDMPTPMAVLGFETKKEGRK